MRARTYRARRRADRRGGATFTPCVDKRTPYGTAPQHRAPSAPRRWSSASSSARRSSCSRRPSPRRCRRSAGVLVVWAAAGLLTLIGALVVAELASAWPRTGGVYVFLRELYSPGRRVPVGLGDVLDDALADRRRDRDGVRALRRHVRSPRRRRTRALVAVAGGAAALRGELPRRPRGERGAGGASPRSRCWPSC